MKNHVADMTQGNILRHILPFAFPLMISGFVQVLYTTVGSMILGHFSGDASLAAVGSSAPAINILITIFLGFSAASNVIIAKKIGSGDENSVSKTLHTAAALCFLSSIILVLIGLIFCEQILIFMNIQKDIFELSALYMRMYFLGVPALLIYNFGRAVMCAMGKAKYAMYIITFSGILNVALNFLFIGCLHLGVWGTGISLILSEVVSAVLVLHYLMTVDTCCRLSLKKLRFVASDLKWLLLQGFKIGFQSTAIAFSNLIVQRAVNECGSTVMAGNSAANAIEGLIYIVLNAFLTASLTFTAQNLGAGYYKRIQRGLLVNLGMVTLLGIVLTQWALLAGPWLLGFFSDSEEVLAIGMERLRIVGGLYVFSGLMEVVCGAIHGLGKAGVTTFASLVGDCGIRLIMLHRYEASRNLRDIYYSFPLAWLTTAIILMLGFFIIFQSKKYNIKKSLLKKGTQYV